MSTFTVDPSTAIARRAPSMSLSWVGILDPPERELDLVLGTTPVVAEASPATEVEPGAWRCNGVSRS